MKRADGDPTMQGAGHDRRCDREGQVRGECGGSALYVVLLLPIVFGLAAIGIDVSSWNALRTVVQHRADLIAVEAARRLPDREAVLRFVRSEIEGVRRSGELADIEAEILGDAPESGVIGVRLSLAYQPTFAKIIRGLAGAEPGAESGAFAIRREAFAQKVPADAVIIIADGATLRPRIRFDSAGLYHSFDEPWGDAEEWPSSSYFSCAAPPTLEFAPFGWRWWEVWREDKFQRWATQSCWNPVLSAVKQSAIAVVRSVADDRRNRLALIFTPGRLDGAGAFVSRPLRGVDDHEIARWGFAGSAPFRAQWSGYIELERFLGDEVCLLLENLESARDGTYSVEPDTIVSRGSGCAEPLDGFLCGGRHQASGNIQRCYLEDSLTLEDAIRYHAARIETPSLPSVVNLTAAIERAWSELVATSGESERSLARGLRGNLTDRAGRRIFVITDALPKLEGSDGGAIQESLSLLASHHIELTLFVINHEWLSPNDRLRLNEALVGWLDIASAKERRASGLPTIRIFIAPDPGELRRQVDRVVPELLSQVVLRR